MNQRKDSIIAGAIIALLVTIIGAGAYVGSTTSANYQGGNGGSPSAVAGTPTVEPTVIVTETPTPEETLQPEIVELPATGAGVTAPQVKQGNHTGWHNIRTVCQNYVNAGGSLLTIWQQYGTATYDGWVTGHIWGNTRIVYLNQSFRCGWF